MNIKKTTAAFLLLASPFLTTAQAAPDTEGQWSQQIEWSMMPIHAVLTPQGKILTWGVNGISSGQFQYDMWDPEIGTGTSAHEVITSDINITSFCSAGLLLPETGNVLMPGGDARPVGLTNSGITSVAEFNPQNNGLSQAAEMSYARWYPTSITLPDGDILVSGGRDGQLREIVTPEVYSPANNEWRSLFGINTTNYGYYYPKLWVLPNGRILGMQNEKMYYMSTDGQGTLDRVVDLPQTSRGNSSTAVMYSPGKIMQISGESGNSTNGVILVDATGNTPSVRETSRPAEAGRLWANTVVLPDGKVMLVGGSAVLNEAGGASYRPEIWDPATEQWSLMATSESQKMRLYHSVAILMQDGRVLVAGGGAPGPEDNNNGEIFSPSYLFDNSGLADRPTITSAPEEAPYGANISVSHPSSNNITRVTLVKTGAVTHAFNMEQRFIEAEFTDTSTGVNVQIPDSANVATPGYYLMFLLDDKGVPSEAHTIRISDTAVYNESPFPVAITDTGSVAANTPITFNVLVNDIGAGLSVSDYNQYSPNGGTISKVGDALTYTSAAGFAGEDLFWYAIEDNLGRANSAKVTITVTGGAVNNPAPVGTPDTTTVAAGNTITIDVLANDVGNGLQIVNPSQWSLNGGSVAVVNNQFTYTPKDGFTGEDKIWYTLQEVEGRTNWGEVTITVTDANAINPFPVGNPDTASVSSGNTITINVLANDIGNGLQIINPNSWSLNGGSVALVNNAFSYTPKSGFSGQDKIWYVFQDVEGRSSWGEVTINVSP